MHLLIFRLFESQIINSGSKHCLPLFIITRNFWWYVFNWTGNNICLQVQSWKASESSTLGCLIIIKMQISLKTLALDLKKIVFVNQTKLQAQENTLTEPTWWTFWIECFVPFLYSRCIKFCAFDQWVDLFFGQLLDCDLFLALLLNMNLFLRFWNGWWGTWRVLVILIKLVN